MKKTKVDLLHYTFSTSLFGYKKSEVDALIQEISEQLGKFTEENMLLKSKVEELQNRLATYRKREKVLQNTLVTTQKMVEELKVNAKKKAKTILEEAKQKAEDIVKDAHHRLSQVYSDILELKRQRQRFQIELKSLLESHLTLLEEEKNWTEEMDQIDKKVKFMFK
ncbi:MAG: DivIVA domain-containing protein [Desulfonauticus sp.]|nr:DivIVA domain-containing protein [Desulfonauticus sp.]